MSGAFNGRQKCEVLSEGAAGIQLGTQLPLASGPARRAPELGLWEWPLGDFGARRMPGKQMRAPDRRDGPCSAAYSAAGAILSSVHAVEIDSECPGSDLSSIEPKATSWLRLAVS